MPLFVVETISTYRHKYVIECAELEHAFDTVVMQEAVEYSQMHLGEQVITGREITYENFEQMNEALENGTGDGTSYQPETGSPWMGSRMIHKVEYGEGTRGAKEEQTI
jgi:hypothetical protein